LVADQVDLVALRALDDELAPEAGLGAAVVLERRRDQVHRAARLEERGLAALREPGPAVARRDRRHVERDLAALVGLGRCPWRP
jgi:hypothetical protein